MTAKPPHLFLSIAPAIAAICATWAAAFSWQCAGFGCLGVVFLGGAAVLAFLMRVLVLMPICALLHRRAGQKFHKRALVWLALSFASVLLPAFFFEGGIETGAWVLRRAPLVLFRELW